MKTFKIAVEWCMCGVVKVKAKSLDAAIEMVKNDLSILDAGGEYINDSWIVNEELSEEMNK